MRSLIAGIREFQQNVFPNRRARFEQLASGQTPSTLFIACSDSRVVPNLITQTEPGELFELRNAGNLVPPYTAHKSGEAATIEYAVQVLKVADIIVCGHSHCGAITGLLLPQNLEGLPAVKKWLEHAEQTRLEIEEQTLSADGDDDLLTTAIKANILVQLAHLRSFPMVREAEERGELQLHGCFYRFETGDVSQFDDSHQRFISVSHQPAEVIA